MTTKQKKLNREKVVRLYTSMSTKDYDIACEQLKAAGYVMTGQEGDGWADDGKDCVVFEDAKRAHGEERKHIMSRHWKHMQRVNESAKEQQASFDMLEQMGYETNADGTVTSDKPTEVK